MFDITKTIEVIKHFIADAGIEISPYAAEQRRKSDQSTFITSSSL